MRSLLLVAPLLFAASAGAAKPASLLPDFDAHLVLPPPPAVGSEQANAELAELRTIDASRTPEQESTARHDDHVKSLVIFAGAMGAGFDPAKLPATAHLFDLVRATEKDVADRAKAFFLRERPWIVDPALRSCSRKDDPKSSYPSGHTTMAYSMAGVLTRLAPDHAQAILARAANYSQKRVICEVHFRSDVIGGEALGLVIAERLMSKPPFQKDFAAARAELKAAGLTH